MPVSTCEPAAQERRTMELHGESPTIHLVEAVWVVVECFTPHVPDVSGTLSPTGTVIPRSALRTVVPG